jgi:hypothetical protein
MTPDRYHRQELLFGKEGQDRLAAARVAVVGAGGIGSHVIQQAAYLGVGRIAVLDFDAVEESNLNRLVGAWDADLDSGARKTGIAKRHCTLINPAVAVEVVTGGLRCEAGFASVKAATHVFGCVDKDGPRLVLTELCAAYGIPLFDLATDVIPGEHPGDKPVYGGRVCVMTGPGGCPVCYDEIDRDQAGRDLEGAGDRALRGAVYGVPRDGLDARGPAVVNLNGVLASLAVMEFMVAVTGLRDPLRRLEYRGTMGVVMKSRPPEVTDCFYCGAMWGKGESADVERYLRAMVSM